MFKTMLIEDNTSFRKVFKHNLKDQFPSMDLIEAADWGEAFENIASHPPHLIFMDIGLPGENGLELTRKIKAEYPEILVVILTNYNLSEYREAATRFQANYFLSKGSIKPVEIFELVKTILSENGFNGDGSDRANSIAADY